MSNEDLKKHCEHIADTISDGIIVSVEDIDNYGDDYSDQYEEGDTLSGWDYIREAYSFRWLIDSDGDVIEAQLMVAGGGPEIWVHISEDGSGRVEGYWWGDRYTARITDDPMDVFNAAEELYRTKG